MSAPIQLVAYGLTNALQPVFPFPIVALRAPTTADIKYPLGQIWIYKNNASYILLAVVANAANWSEFQGSGSFTNLTVTGNFTQSGGTASINATGAGNTLINSTSNTGTISIGNALSGAETITVGTGNFSLVGGGNTISLGSDAAANTVSLGSTTNGAITTVNGGNGTGLGTAAIVLQSATAGDIQIGTTSQTGILYLAPSTAAHTVNLSAGANTGAQVVNISSGASGANSTVNILSGNGSAGTQTANILTGTRAGVVNIGTGAAAHQITIGSSTASNLTTLASPITALPGPVYIYTGAGVPSNGLALHVGDLYINTTAATSTTRMYIATAASTWTNVTCAA